MRNILIPALTLLFSMSSFAQETASVTENTNTIEAFDTVSDTIKNKKGGILKEIIVTQNQHKKPVSAIRSGLKPMDVPQSIQIIGSEIIEQQQAIRLSDVIKNINGVYVGSARGGAQESFFSRGYDMSTNNMFKNGFRFSSGSIPEVSSLEKVEVLKGSAALLYGNVAPGGILNMVTKSPSFQKGGEIAVQMGSYSFYKPSIDIYGPLNDIIAYRFTGSYENSESFRDNVTKERYYINPSVLFKASDKTEILLQGDYLKDDWTPDFGTGIIGKEIVDLPRNTYLGATWSNGQTKQATVSGLVSHNFNKNWKLDFNSSFQNYNRTSKGTERVQPAANGDWSRPLGQNKNLEQIIGEQISLQGCFTTGQLKHQLFTGVDLENSFAQAYTFTFNPTTYGSGNIFDFENFDQGGAIPNATNTRIVKTDTNRFGIYAQDLISLTEKIKVLAGLRWSWQEAQVNTHDLIKNTVTEAAKRKDLAFTPKVGLVFQPTKDMSLFASYSNSFTPNTGTTVDLKAIEPSIIDQYEVGMKKDFWKGVLSTNVTVYQITNSNLAQTAEFKADGSSNTDTTIKVLSGETTSKGVEFDITAKPIEGLNIIAGYSYNDMRYTKTSGLNGSFIEGDRLARTPANTANLSFFYTLPSGILKGASFGASGNYIGNRVGGWNNQIVANSNTGAVTINDREIPLEGYTTIDLSAGYNWKQFSILCKLSNITNELNYTVHENYSVNPIAPRQVMTSLKYKF
ncbi:TonB-dependent siderophore receptor [Flavobacterium gawalongense]|uniref:TonB-dependent siderophore receptor n=1 Tax=Flavobacterium gawalongense TaxID=2594432 RepID=A0A553BQW9_9FLAO|nr:TonB-dependent siderophore receptor [Flavobacterium gawalongense]TRX00977.1 TonB-dependent siderophore receptor [Flavobacterium gawalongense]TRX05484.1 TonB-dependent siderophore receptor [Flavobacterium gawalongense]TRX10652.1 TonB-dependent siderophore receptor [Flavobacterium gawalongense]TRX11801.1 TonB-dependent siderophore receptor [Flavobacterium gawalongense]TRX29593.1 TonB-dependent siderophore receptor [Flavobacterium gawalongense]